MADKTLNKREMFLGDMGILTCSLLWGVSFAAMKEVFNSMGPLWLLAFRFGLTFLLLAMMRPGSIAKIDRSDVKVGTVIGLLLVISMALQTIGLQYITTGKSAFLTAAYVVLVPFIVWRMEKVSPGSKAFVAALICLVGMGILTLDGSISLGMGELLTIGCAATFAIYIIAIDRMASGKDALTMTMIETGIGGAICLIGALIYEPVPTAIPLSTMGWIGYLVIFCTLVPYALQIKSQQYTTPTHTSMVSTTESVFAVMIGVMILGEPLTFRLVMGCSLILLSVVITELDLSAILRPASQKA